MGIIFGSVLLIFLIIFGIVFGIQYSRYLAYKKLENNAVSYYNNAAGNI